jgi:glutaminyl-peptide cyclotransferase
MLRGVPPFAFGGAGASLRAMRDTTKWFWRSAAFAAVLAFGMANAYAAATVACAMPKAMRFVVSGSFERSIRGFTQGLEVRGDTLFESTGLVAGTTRLTTIDHTGKVTVLADFGKSFFGEGLTILKNNIYQLSWQEHAVFVYDLSGKQLRKMTNPHDGWGLTNDGANLLATDGSDQLYVVNPANFTILRQVPVRAGAMPVGALNELEMVDGKVYANIFTTWTVVRFDPATGCVDAVANLRDLWDRLPPAEQDYLETDSNFVLNGIAYDAKTKTFYVTGKNWKTIFTGEFVSGN